MRITSKHYKKLLNLVHMLHDHNNEYEMRQAMAEPLLGIMGADYFASFCWVADAGRYDQSVYLNMDDRNIDKYLEYYQYRDPITRKLALRRAATRVEEIIPLQQFHRSEFFNDFLLVDGLYHGINLHLYHYNDNIGDLRIWRKRGRDNFDESSQSLLNLLKPHLIQAIQNLRRRKQTALDSGPSTLEEKCRFLKREFRLTSRESEVVHYILSGDCDDAIAMNLHISVATVRTHIKHIYAKTGVHNRCKLQSLTG